MAYKVVIDDIVGVKVEGAQTDGNGDKKPFSFVLFVERVNQEGMRQVIGDSKMTANEFFEQHARGWKDQKLVVDDAGQPADFTVDALKALFTITNMAMVCWNAYLAQVQVTAKN